MRAIEHSDENMSDQEARFFNRELSWLEFNQRVLDEATDESLPLLERIRFLAITASNLDEFFMVRVGGLQTLAERGSAKRDPAGMTPEEQLTAISKRTHELTRAQYACWNEQLEPLLEKAGIRRLRPGGLTVAQQKLMTQVFHEVIDAIVAPLAISSTDDFPLVINRSLNMLIRLERGSQDGSDDREQRFAVIPFGRIPMRFVTLPSEGSYSFVFLEEVIEQHVGHFFPDETIVECAAFRMTRNADMAIREDLAADLLGQMEQLLVARKESDCVRLEVALNVSDESLTFLQECLGVESRDVYRIPGPLDLTQFSQLADAGSGEENRFVSWPPKPSPQLDPQESIFAAIARRDILLYHPYESFDPVVRLVEQAADDPDVLAIKQTLYRTSRNSPIVAALARAAGKGKHVTVIVELKARFDEAQNIEWARALEQAGVQVFYGVKGLKTHAKICIVVRREPHGIQRYVHFGTGNYNDVTARFYSDISLLTCDDELGSDAIAFFSAVTGYSLPRPLRHLAAAPINLRERLEEMIEAEIDFTRQNQDAAITAKINSLVDPGMIELLYKASQAGVKIKLNIRGICCLRPGVPGLSENIEVVSVIDRILEHARVFHFRHGGDNRVLFSSADWMGRNLDRRVELLVPVRDRENRMRLIEIMKCYFRDPVKARRLKKTGRYLRFKQRLGQRLPAQQWLYEQTCEAVERAARSKQTVFEPLRAPSQE